MFSGTILTNWVRTSWDVIQPSRPSSWRSGQWGSSLRTFDSQGLNAVQLIVWSNDKTCNSSSRWESHFYQCKWMFSSRALLFIDLLVFLKLNYKLNLELIESLLSALGVGMTGTKQHIRPWYCFLTVFPTLFLCLQFHFYPHCTSMTTASELSSSVLGQ